MGCEVQVKTGLIGLAKMEKYLPWFTSHRLFIQKHIKERNRNKTRLKLAKDVKMTMCDDSFFAGQRSKQIHSKSDLPTSIQVIFHPYNMTTRTKGKVVQFLLSKL
jgi:hypothetical protein